MTPFDESPAPMPPGLEFWRLVFHVEQVRRKTGIFVRETLNRILSLIVAVTVSATLTPSVRSETSLKSTTGSGDYRDWQHFNPQKFTAPDRLIPAASVAPQHSASYEKGVPSFPQDPTHANVIYGRGKDELPTAIYAKAFDVLQIGGKLFQAPAAGEVKQVTVDGQGIAIYGTTVYTPLPNTAMVGNPVQVKPFDPSRIFYKDNDLWPSVIYAEPGKEITIANQKVVVPAAGQSVALIFDASGHLKQPAQQGNASSDSEKSAAEKAASEKAASEKAALDKASSERAAAEKAASEKAAAEKAASEKAATEKAAAEKAFAEKVVAEQAAAQKAAAEKAAAEKALAAAAEKLAAEKLAAEKAAAEKSAEEKAAVNKSAAENAAASTGSGGSGSSSSSNSEPTYGGLIGGHTVIGAATPNDSVTGPTGSVEVPEDLVLPPLPRFDISGDWSTQNTTTSNQFKLRISYEGTFITAVIVDQGSGYIPAGQTRFKGDYTSNPFSVTVQRAYAGYTNPYWEPGTATIADPSSMTITARTGNLVLHRIWQELASDISPTPHTKSSGTTVSQPSGSPPKSTTNSIPSQLMPQPRGYEFKGQTYLPSDAFTEKIRDFIAGLPKSVQDWLVKNHYTIIVEAASKELPQTWANTHTGKNEIRFQENTYHEPIGNDPGGFDKTEMEMAKELYSQGRHEVGHALAGEKGLDTNKEFLSIYNAEVAALKPEVRAKLEKYSDGHGDGRSPFTNATSGASETIAQLVGYELNGRNPMSVDVHSAFPKTAKFVNDNMPYMLK